MQESVELVIDEKFVGDLFSTDELQGRQFGVSLRSVVLAPDDARLEEIGRRDRERRLSFDRSVIAVWNIRRRYSSTELERAELFYLKITEEVMDSGEAYGTVYDRSSACPICGAGEQQASDLILDLRKVPKSADIAATLRHERLASQRLAEIFLDAEASGFELWRVHHKVRHDEDPIDPRKFPSGRELLQKAEAAGYPHPGASFWVWLNRAEQDELLRRMEDEYLKAANEKHIRRPMKPQAIWYQLRPTSTVEVHSQTKFGINPFDDDPEGEYRCPLGHARGLNIISEAFVRRDSWDGSDLAACSDWVGAPATPLVPRARYHKLLFISPRLWRLLREHKVKGWRVEIAHLV